MWVGSFDITTEDFAGFQPDRSLDGTKREVLIVS
jgi:hypothetical protein